MTNILNLTDAELLSDFRHIETHLRYVKDHETLLGGPIAGQVYLISEIVRLTRLATPATDETYNLKRALTSFVK